MNSTLDVSIFTENTSMLLYGTCLYVKRYVPFVMCISILVGIVINSLFKTVKSIRKKALFILVVGMPMLLFAGTYLLCGIYDSVSPIPADYDGLVANWKRTDIFLYGICNKVRRYAPSIIACSMLAGVLIRSLFRNVKSIRKWTFSVLIVGIPAFVFVGSYMACGLYDCFNS